MVWQSVWGWGQSVVGTEGRTPRGWTGPSRHRQADRKRVAVWVGAGLGLGLGVRCSEWDWPSRAGSRPLVGTQDFESALRSTQQPTLLLMAAHAKLGLPTIGGPGQALGMAPGDEVWGWFKSVSYVPLRSSNLGPETHLEMTR